ncbi:peptidase [Mangrovimicrobium sediminis]|uniref:Peptidase n=1 Tax=Mangrovimicrobium sediminis TaxID=2562682 RepID=A0A4Z0M8B7_9GAMM|nr:peptidase [Haliea sp. SAOS-164]TGD75637.1 peptidase [Haliea sp. SAOS-164]
MTYCIGIRLKEGLVFCSDSRTNAGPDRVSTYGKLHRFSLPGERQLMLMTAGNLATSQAVVAQIERDLREDASFNVAKAQYVSDIADYIGKLGLNEQKKYASGGPGAGFNAEATYILGGQIKGQPTELYLVYPEGNHITVSEQYPFLQIGETKYGKPILDRIIRPDTDHETAMRCALVSMDSTMRSNATVGPPIELLYYAADTLADPAEYCRFEENDEYLVSLRRAWDDNIRRAFNDLPSLQAVFDRDL